MIHQDDGEHGFGNWCRPDADTGIMATGRHHLDRITLDIHRATSLRDAGGRFEGDRHQNLLSSGNAPQNAAGIVGEKSLRRDFVTVLRTLLRDALEPGTDFNTLDGVDVHHGMGNVGIEAIKHRFTQPHRHTGRHNIHARTNRVAVGANLIHDLFKLRNLRRVRSEEGILLDGVPVLELEHDRPELGKIATDHSAVLLLEPFLGDRAGGDAQCCFARTGTTTATIITETVLLLIGVIGMTRAKPVHDLGVIVRALVGVLD